ncbi:PH domain-containing protein [Fulvivirga sediminis]|uniref:PH domain-containing protein n=1 Tax=Fulvivirga sediminis TaxID=2803949 RepID=A0A937F5I0_9BACT|nr:PH domain-containing protein [Fulvivirga sediminis]MBL3654634.1 PH domain-containing protein [Fulvivirga sediminis]
MDVSVYAIPAVAIIVMFCLMSASKKQPQVDVRGNVILKLPIFYLIIGLFAVIGAIAVLIHGLINHEPESPFALLFIVIMMLGLGIPLLLMGLNFRLIIKDEGVEQRTMLGQTQKIEWSEIHDVSFGKVSLELNIISDSNKIKVHMHSIGFVTLLEALESHTDFNRIKIGIPQ